MTYRPAGDERLVVPDPGDRTTERVFLTELARYLHHRSSYLKAFAKQHGFLRSSPTQCGRAYWVRPYGAMRIIAYIRALQGDAYLQGKQFHEERAKWAEQAKRKRERKKMGERV